MALWGEHDCAPWSLIIDYDSGLLTPEEYTGYAFYPLMVTRPWVSGDHEFPLPLPVPARYEMCDADEDEESASIQVAGFAAGLYIEDLDPEFRDRLWLWHSGQTYEDATRVYTDDEFDDALCQFDPALCD